MATTSTSARFTRSWWLSNATGTPKSLLAASADSRRLVDSAVISKSSASDFNAGMCASAAQPRSGLAPMMPTRILLAPLLIADGLDMKGDLDLIAHDRATRFQQRVPLKPELLAAERGLGREPCSLLPVRVRDLTLEL